MSEVKTTMPHTWSKALLDCVTPNKETMLKEGEKIDHNIIDKLVQVSTIPTWNSNVHKYRH
ncbi:dynobactin A family peptide antibiotic [Sodalis sp. RH21]|uniref:dynobactin A family peptide antibiotic n=1 Tax=unclassified Sodalis (in: enterobacteria) TaxID=2636512 RepID=UPI0039B5E44F